MLSAAEREDIEFVMNEAELFDADFDAEGRRAFIALAVLTLPEQGPVPDDPTVQFYLTGVTRVAASLRQGRWNDAQAPVVSIALEQLREVVRSFGGRPIYGGEFIDRTERAARAEGRWSLDWRAPDHRSVHLLEVFQEGQDESGHARHLDLFIWFEHIQFYVRDGSEVALRELVAGTQRCWNAIRSGDPRAAGWGIVSL